MRALRLSPVRLTFGVLTAAAIAVALLLLSGSPTITNADDLGPDTDNSTNYGYTAEVASTTPGAARAMTTVFSVPAPGNINFSNLITFDPAADTTQSCNAGLVGGFATTHNGNTDPCLKSGEVVGTLSSDTRLGMLGSLCWTTFTVPFVFYAVALPNNLADPDASTNIAYTQPQGTDNRFERWGTLPIGVGGGTEVDKSSTANGDTQSVIADADNIMFKNYPEFLLDLFRTAGGTPVVPHAVYGSLTFVAGTSDVPLFLVIFRPGQLSSSFAAPNPLGRATANLGYASQTVLNDPTATVASPSSISAFCATTSTTILNATVGGITRATNPAAGTHLNLAWMASQRDLDNDGVENALDTCLLKRNIDGDPRDTGGDPDGDMLDSICDPNPGSYDGDQFSDTGWYNTQDNCPLILNPAQASSEGALGVAAGYAAGRADDGGPLGDGIGDACDTGTFTSLANTTYNHLSTTITLSPTIANGRWAARAIVNPICYGLTDADGDGYCKEDADAFDTNKDRWNSWMTDADLSVVLGKTSTAGAGSWDTDGGGGDPIIGGDGSPDFGFDSDWLETYVGTDASQPCSLTSTIGDEPLDAWLYDVNDDQKANLSDVLGIAPVFLQTATTAAHLRFDWNADGFVNLSDVLGIAPVFLNKCVPVVAPQ